MMDRGAQHFVAYCCTVFVFFLLIGYSDGQSFSMHMYHKFSDEVKGWMSEKHGVDARSWPMKHSSQYYDALYRHDHARHARFLAQDDGPLTFLAGNQTQSSDSLGYLFYTVVQLGTPNISVLAALDTGSDLFWVPCDCKQCAGTNSVQGQTYSPSTSKTSNKVTCSSDLCDQSQTCNSTNDQCPYTVQYASDNTSSSGVLVQDILYLTPNNKSESGKVVNATITFGCGMVQSGVLVEGSVSYGLLGLGKEAIAVPTMLSKLNLVANSFSMCFPIPDNGDTGNYGRFVFGEKGSLDQKEAPFTVLNTSKGEYHGYYASIQEISVGNSSFKTNFEALFDSGTSFTYFTDSIYNTFTSYYHSQVTDSTLSVGDNIPFQYCYQSSKNQSLNEVQKIALNVGGSEFSVFHPWVYVGDQTGSIVGYCLAVLQSSSTSLSIIGQNFMRGYQIIFDREKGTYGTLGWKKANCFDLTSNNSGYTPSNYSTSSSVAPSTLEPSWVANTSRGNTAYSPVSSANGPAGSKNSACQLGRTFFVSLPLSCVISITIFVLSFGFL